MVKDCAVKEIRRVGCRMTFIFQSKFTFSDLTDLLHNRLFSTDKKVLELSGGKVQDLAYVLDAESNEFKTHVQMGAVNKEQGRNEFRAKFKHEKELKDDNNLFFDMDVSVSGKLTTDNTIDYLGKVIAKNQEIMDKYLDYLSN
jgi:hypothetical protein